jgi:hypothetical protein
MEADHRRPQRVRQRATQAADHVIGEFVAGRLTRREMSLVGHGARSVPNAFLEAPLQSTNSKSGSGSWNAARVNHPAYVLSKRYIAALDLSSQRRMPCEIQRLLLADAYHLRLLLRLPRRHSQEHHRCLPGWDR